MNILCPILLGASNTRSFRRDLVIVSLLKIPPGYLAEAVILGDSILSMTLVKEAQVIVVDPSNSFPKTLIGRLRAGTAHVKSDQCMDYTQEDRGRKNV